MSAAHWDIDAIRAMVGREVTYTAPEPIGAAAGRYYALAIGDDNPIYTDVTAARDAGWEDLVVPPTLLAETNQYVTGIEVDEHGHRGHRWAIETTNCRQIRGGNDYTFHRHAHPDDVVTATWSIESVEEKVARDGTPMLVVGSLATYRRADGELLLENREALIWQARS